MLVSVIVPFFNSAHTLEKCVRSILSQSYRSLEIILVNDGSTDESFKVAKALAAVDYRIIVIDRSNGGVSAARNTALEVAKGEWIAFVDSDDEILPDYILSLLQLSEPGCLAVQGILRKPVDSERLVQYLKYEDKEVDLGTYMTSNSLTAFGYSCAKLYSAEIVRGQGIKFDERLRFAEDAIFLLEYLAYVERIRFSSRQLYIYRDSPGGLLRRKYPYATERHLLDSAEQRLRNLYQRSGVKLDAEGRYLHLAYYIDRVLQSILKIEAKRERRELLGAFFNEYNNEIRLLYSKSKFRGKILSTFVRLNSPVFFENFYFKIV